MKKILLVLYCINLIVTAKAQYKIQCGNLSFVITAKKLGSITQANPSTNQIVTTTFYYAITNDKLQVWQQVAETKTISLSVYEIEKNKINAGITGEIASYEPGEYRETVNTVFIKCNPQTKDVSVKNYVDWNDTPDLYPWSFISISSSKKEKIELAKKEIFEWLASK